MGIYEELGVKRIINGAATLTAIGGSIMPPEVLDSMKEASQSYVSIIELQHKAGAQIAKWTKTKQPWYPNGSGHGSGYSSLYCRGR